MATSNCCVLPTTGGYDFASFINADTEMATPARACVLCKKNLSRWLRLNDRMASIAVQVRCVGVYTSAVGCSASWLRPDLAPSLDCGPGDTAMPQQIRDEGAVGGRPRERTEREKYSGMRRLRTFALG